MTEANTDRERGGRLIGLAVVGCVTVGLISFVLGILAVLDQKNGFQGAGACFIASALSWGCLVNALLRK